MLNKKTAQQTGFFYLAAENCVLYCDLHAVYWRSGHAAILSAEVSFSFQIACKQKAELQYLSARGSEMKYLAML